MGDVWAWSRMHQSSNDGSEANRHYIATASPFGGCASALRSPAKTLQNPPGGKKLRLRLVIATSASRAPDKALRH